MSIRTLTLRSYLPIVIILNIQLELEVNSIMEKILI